MARESTSEEARQNIKIAIVVAYASREPFIQVRESTERILRQLYSINNIDLYYVKGRSLSRSQKNFRDKLERLRWGRWFWLLRIFDFVTLSTYKFKFAKCKLNGCEFEVDVPDDIRHLLPKLLSAYENLKDDYQWIIRTTVHSLINAELVKRELLELEVNQPVFGGRLIKQSDGTKFISGSFTFLNSECIKLVLRSKNSINFTLIDDVALSRLIETLNIPIKELPSLDITNTNMVIELDNLKINEWSHFRCRTLAKNEDDINLLQSLLEKIK